jgi:hypothetical protein
MPRTSARPSPHPLCSHWSPLWPAAPPRGNGVRSDASVPTGDPSWCLDPHQGSYQRRPGRTLTYAAPRERVDWRAALAPRHRREARCEPTTSGVAQCLRRRSSQGPTKPDGCSYAVSRSAISVQARKVDQADAADDGVEVAGVDLEVFAMNLADSDVCQSRRPAFASAQARIAGEMSAASTLGRVPHRRRSSNRRFARSLNVRSRVIDPLRGSSTVGRISCDAREGFRYSLARPCCCSAPRRPQDRPPPT